MAGWEINVTHAWNEWLLNVVVVCVCVEDELSALRETTLLCRSCLSRTFLQKRNISCNSILLKCSANDMHHCSAGAQFTGFSVRIWVGRRKLPIGDEGGNAAMLLWLPKLYL